MHKCPVCGYDKLRRPFEDEDIICPSCGTEFGYTDATRSHAELRQRWLDAGAHWYSRVTPEPPAWNAYEQLKRAGFINYAPKSEDTQRGTGVVGIIGLTDHVTVVELPEGSVTIRSRDYGVGRIIHTLRNQVKFATA
jgi:hypothetical protein